MGVISTNPNSMKSDSKTMDECKKKPAEDVEAGDSFPEDQENKHAHLTGAANVLVEWPELILRALVLMVLGAALGALLAVLLRLILPQLVTPGPEKAHLHMATTNLTARRACALEALASRHADRPLHLVLLRQHPQHTVQTVYRLTQSYPNLKVHFHPDPEVFFESSPLDGFPQLGGADDLLELAARTLALWRHGGASVDLDRPVMDLPPHGEFVQRGGGSLLQFPQPCHPALHGLLASLGEDSQSSARDAIARATQWICHLNDLEGKGEEFFKPEKCLGVNVVEDKTESHENLQCPVVRSVHHTIIHQGKPVVEFSVDYIRKPAQPQKIDNVQHMEATSTAHPK